MSDEFEMNPINISKAMDIFDNDVELFLDLINKFIRIYPRYLKKIIIALNDTNLNELEAASYRIRSLLVNLACYNAEEYLYAIERFKDNYNLNDAVRNYNKLNVELKRLKDFVTNSGWDKLFENIKEMSVYESIDS